MRKNTSTRLWDKGAQPDELVHRFTVGDDPYWDAHLVHWDCLGSAAHARTLEKAGFLTAAETEKLVAALGEIDALAAGGEFDIPAEMEDCHTAIENHLTRKLGEIGEKIHAGRSRNDQVATAMRLFMRRRTLDWLDLLDSFASAALQRIRTDGSTPMPGYTHMQPAMPSSIGLWLHAFVEAALEQMRAGLDLYDRLDACPLGSGAGFGVPLPLDREFTAGLLGFARVQRNPIDVQNSRGRLEIYFTRVAADIGGLLEKLSWDMILYSSAEYGFITLPDAMTTGSSIMPQKRNPDVLELMRARAGRLRGLLQQLEWIAGKLPSSYHRDLQLTKEPTIRAALDAAEMLPVAERIIAEFTINKDKLAAAMRPELYATHAAYALVRQGTPFRRAYRQIAADIRSGKFVVPADAADSSSGRVDAAAIDAADCERQTFRSRAEEFQRRIMQAEATLLNISR